MSQEELLNLLKELVVELTTKANPGHSSELVRLRSIVDKEVTLESPLASLGWDSLQMTFLLVTLEERLDIDTSTLSLFDLYSVSDFLGELKLLIDQKTAQKKG